MPALTYDQRNQLIVAIQEVMPRPPFVGIAWDDPDYTGDRATWRVLHDKTATPEQVAEATRVMLAFQPE